MGTAATQAPGRALPERAHGLPDPRRALPGSDQVAVWAQFLRTHAGLVRRLEAELVARQGMTLAEYDVLVQLSEAPGHALRMTELADRVLLSRSGITRLVDRLQRDRLVERRPCAGDARGVECVLTPTGRARLRDAASTHLVGVAEAFVEPLGDEGLAELAVLLARVARRTRMPGDDAPAAGCGT